jgi:hypothetical protein
MAEQPQQQDAGATHTYVSRAWYRDTATLFLIGSFLWFVVQDRAMVEMFIPHEYHDHVAKVVLLIAMFIRFKSSTRPVGWRQGDTREVRSIAPREK